MSTLADPANRPRLAPGAAGADIARPNAAADTALAPPFAPAEDPAGRLLYLDHFGLARAPFQNTPRPEFFYGACDRGQMLYALLYCLRQDQGITLLTGEEGSGKSMLAHMLRHCAPAAMDIALIGRSALQRADVVPMIADRLGISTGRAAPDESMRLLQRVLTQRQGAGRRAVLIVDDAQDLRDEVLDEIRRLALLQGPAHALLHILLVGQDALRLRVADAANRDLDACIRQRLRLAPLPVDEVGAYLAFRMQRAGASADAFDPAAARMIGRGAMGLIGRVNILADKCLMAAFNDDFPRVMRSHVELALNDAAFRAMRASHAPPVAPARASTLGRLWRRYGLGRVGPR